MNKLSKYIIACMAGVGALSFSACQKALEEKPYSFYSPENFYKNENDAKAAINGVYNHLYSYDLYMQPFWNMTILDDDHVSGADWFVGTTGAGNPQAYWGYSGPWIGSYAVIARACSVIENVGKMENLNAELKQRILGEAYFLRGWSYFNLVQLYGGVPIRTESLSGNNPETNVPRASVKDTYAQVISDLKEAEAKLYPAGDPRSGEAGRVTQGVAKAMLAKTYLTMASGSLAGASISVRGGTDNGVYTYQKTVVAGLEGLDTKAYYTLARDKAQEVINSGQYALTQNWNELWSTAGRNNREQMWMIQSLAGSPFMNNLGVYFSARSTFGVGAVWKSNNHYKDYEDQDKRILDGVTHNYTTLQGTNIFYPSWEADKYKVVNGVNYNNTGSTTAERAYVIKFSAVADPEVALSDAFFPIIRYSELYLMVAEAENEINGPNTVAYQALNTIRRRVSASDASPNMNVQDFRSFVLAERAREFALEGIRRFDLIRWGIYLPVMNKIGTGQNNISKVRNTRNLLFPIPLNELNANTAIIENNPGW
ncbi:MAG: RagB/SusD family nutrient uptake outer membrane protein [Pedobacter sp.]|nr:MAG: RagB/SusD family nutrient uptake outer membrane protein [Pedobacter sp.]